MQTKHGLSSMVMIGDGATDLEARQPGGADLFIGCALHTACHRMLMVDMSLERCQEQDQLPCSNLTFSVF